MSENKHLQLRGFVTKLKLIGFNFFSLIRSVLFHENLYNGNKHASNFKKKKKKRKENFPLPHLPHSDFITIIFHKSLVH